MASRRWLLVLMLWLLPWLQIVVKSGFVKLTFPALRNWRNADVVIPKDGIYLVSVIGDPCPGCVTVLKVSCRCQGRKDFIVQANSKDIYDHAQVAVPLKKGDTLFVSNGPTRAKEYGSLAVLYVAELNSFYITAMNSRLAHISPITYTVEYTLNAGWRKLKDFDRITTFDIPTTGLYWVTANVVPDHDKYMLVKVCSGSGTSTLLHLYVKKVKPVSASGAFWLRAGGALFMITKGGSYQTTTFLSAVYLAGNKKPNTYPFEHMAFTAWIRAKQTMRAKQLIDFQKVKIDYGSMYVDGYTQIRRTGSYMVSLRPHPENSTELMMSLYVNGTIYWTVFAQQCVPVGVTISLQLQVGSYLEVRARNEALYGGGTLYSIAFIQP